MKTFSGGKVVAKVEVAHSCAFFTLATLGSHRMDIQQYLQTVAPECQSLHIYIYIYIYLDV